MCILSLDKKLNVCKRRTINELISKMSAVIFDLSHRYINTGILCIGTKSPEN